MYRQQQVTSRKEDDFYILKGFIRIDVEMGLGRGSKNRRNHMTFLYGGWCRIQM